MIEQAAVARTLKTVAKGIQSGAQKLIGGRVDGCFFEPAVFEQVPQTSPLWTEEIFAPVLCLASYERFEEALGTVNQSRYGLQTGIFTRDFAEAWKAFESLETGAVLINEIPTWRVENMPYGGTKDSGLGREGVSVAIEEMTESRSWIWNTLPTE
jgi:glyceraldehyde-3-phosphate dehydrogenase (NADP+)